VASEHLKIVSKLRVQLIQVHYIRKFYASGSRSGSLFMIGSYKNATWEKSNFDSHLLPVRPAAHVVDHSHSTNSEKKASHFDFTGRDQR
jgi:hypothetical protein